MSAFDPSLLQRPVCLFPLPNCVLLPGAALPLHVFEPRYRRMVGDLLALPDGRRLIAISLLLDSDAKSALTNEAAIEPVVGVGEVAQCMALPDGTYNILMVGRARARIVRDDRTGVYRRAELRFLPSRPRDMLSTVHDAIDDVRTLLGDFRHFEIADREMIAHLLELSPDPTTLIDVGAFHLLGADESGVKQRILAEERLEVRAEILAIHLRQRLHQWRARQFQSSSDWPPVGPMN